MTAETIHTCSYECERPECIRAQRDELVSRLEALTAAQQQGQVAPPSAPVGVEGYLVERLHGDGYGPARVIVDAAIYDPTNNAFWSGPEAQARHRVTPLVPALAQQPAAVDEAMVERACDAYVQIADDCMGLVRRKAMAAALTAALATQHQEPTT